MASVAVTSSEIAVTNSGITVTDSNFNVTESSSLESGTEAAERDITYYVYMAGEIIIAIIAICGNALLGYVIIKRPQLHTTTNWLTVSLAAADFLVGIIGIPCALVGFNGRPTEAYGCLLVNTIIVIFTQISIFGLLVIAIERFTAIKFPYEYTAHFTPSVAGIAIIVYWILAILIGLVPLFGWNLMQTYSQVYCVFTDIIDMEYMVYFNFFGCVLTPLIIMFLIYCYIFKVVQKQSRQIAALQVVENQQSTQYSNFKKELKAAKWFAIVIGFFAICWLPMHILNTLGIYGISYPFELLLFTILLSHLNSAVNPILYGYANSKVMAALKKTLGLKLSGSEVDSFGVTRNEAQIINPSTQPSKSRIPSQLSVLSPTGHAEPAKVESTTLNAQASKYVDHSD